LIKASLGIALLLVLGTACSGTGRAAPSPTETPDEAVRSVERGRALFRDKGCIACHVNERVDGPQGEMGGIGPILTDYRNDPALLQRWLSDPAAVKPGTLMPNLHLSEAEIQDLIAFLNEPR
jgi:cytochrome c2